MKRCPKCNQENPDDAMNCENCRINLAWALKNYKEPVVEEPKRQITENISLPAGISTLSFIAWVYLIASIISSVITLAFTFGLGLLIALGILMQGLFVWAFSLAIVSIAKNIHYIRDARGSL